MTEEHRYNTPEKGTEDWHEPLNENFKQLDTDVEIRDTEEARDEYDPKAGAKFFATNTGRIYTGDGETWNRVSIATEDQAFEQVALVPRTGTSNSIPIEPDRSALREGYLVGEAAKTQVVIDPLEYDSDAAAIQDAHDQLIDELDEFGHWFNGNGILWIPALKPDGTQWVIDETVTFHWEASSRSGVYPRGWGFTGRQGPAIQLAIDDGSPAFHINRVLGQGTWLGGMRAEGYNGGEDCEFLRLERVTAFHIDKIGMRGFGGSKANGAITFDSGCYNSFINNVRYNDGREDVTEGSFFAFRDLNDSGDSPGELTFGDGISTYADPDSPYKHAFDLNGDFSNSTHPGYIYIRGRYEGYGDHAIVGETGSVILCDGLEFGRAEDIDGTGTSRIKFSGHRLVVSPGVVVKGDSAGAPDMVVNPRHGKIGSFKSSGGREGVALRVPEDSGSNKLVVPREQSFSRPVEYPETFRQLVYPDGYQRRQSGTVTVPGGGSVILSRWAGRSQHSVQVRTNMANADDFDHDVWYTVEKGRSRDDHCAARIVDKTEDFDGEYDVHYVIEALDERESDLTPV